MENGTNVILVYPVRVMALTTSKYIPSKALQYHLRLQDITMNHWLHVRGTVESSQIWKW